MAKKDNGSGREKIALRQRLLRDVSSPVVMETHGGAGHCWRACYADIPQGIVIEKDSRKASLLAGQRPTWAVYQGDCVAALAAGAGRHLAVNVLDIDPYGEPWPVVDAFFQSDRPRVPLLHIAVNDGLRQKLKLGGAWAVHSLESIVRRYGNDLYDSYLDVCELLLREKGAQAGYCLRSFSGYYCGYLGQMTHYWAAMAREG